MKLRYIYKWKVYTLSPQKKMPNDHCTLVAFVQQRALVGP